MTAFDTESSLRWLFCMTHPDDEISICAWIRRLVLNGNAVYISWTHSNAVREAEGRAVAKALGVPQENLRFFGAPDGGVVDTIDRLLPAFGEWIASVKPDRVCCGAFEQGHIDHDSTNFLVNATFDGPVFEIPFYHAYLSHIQTINRFADPSGEQLLDLTNEERRLKISIARRYPSQNIWSVLLWYEVWQKARLRPVELAKTERMRLQTHKDYLTPNLPHRLANRVRRHRHWQRWEQAIEPHVKAAKSGAIPVPS